MSDASESVKSFDSSSSESDAEDVFVYARVRNLPPTFFHKDLVSAICILPEVQVYATHSGIVHIAPNDAPPRTVRVHRASVLSICSDGKYVATASIDGTVVITAAKDAQDTVQAQFKRPVHAIALHPEYSNQKSYVSGGSAGQIVLSEKGWLKARADTVLAQTGSTILALAWIANRIVWCNEDGITVFNTDERVAVSRVRRTNAPRADLSRPRITTNGTNAYIAWASSVYLVDLVSGLLVREYTLSAPVCGVIVYSPTQLAVLLKKEHAELVLVDRHNSREEFADEIELHNSSNLKPNDFHLAQAGALYVVSAGDAVVARERTLRDHVDWLEAHGKLLAAYTASCSADFDERERKRLGNLAAEQLMKETKWEELSTVLPNVLDSNPANWKPWALNFIDAGQHLLIGDVLPHEGLTQIHDKILAKAIEENDSTRVERYVTQWPLASYTPAQAVRLLTLKTTNVVMQSCLAKIYLLLCEYTNAVKVFVKLDSSEGYNLVSQYHLWHEPAILDMLGAIVSAGSADLEGNYVGRLRSLIDVRNELPPARVVQGLKAESSDLLLFGYLTELGQVDETYLSEFADLVVELYVKYDKERLMGFLQRTDTYDLDATIKLCRANNLYNELVFLLGKIGLAHEAIDLLVNKLGDFKRAVDFARTQGPSAFEYLIQYCKNYPQLVLELLKCVDISPTTVLAAVPHEMLIPGLKSALCDVFSEQEINLALGTGALAVVRTESREGYNKLQQLRLAGTEVDTEVVALDWTKPQLFSPEPKEVPLSNFLPTLSGKFKHLRELV